MWVKYFPNFSKSIASFKLKKYQMDAFAKVPIFSYLYHLLFVEDSCLVGKNSRRLFFPHFVNFWDHTSPMCDLIMLLPQLFLLLFLLRDSINPNFLFLICILELSLVTFEGSRALKCKSSISSTLWKCLLFFLFLFFSHIFFFVF